MRKRITVALVGVTFAALAALAFIKDPFVAPMASGIYRLMFCLIAEYAPICIAGIAFLDLADDLYRHIKNTCLSKPPIRGLILSMNFFYIFPIW